MSAFQQYSCRSFNMCITFTCTLQCCHCTNIEDLNGSADFQQRILQTAPCERGQGPLKQNPQSPSTKIQFPECFGRIQKLG